MPELKTTEALQYMKNSSLKRESVSSFRRSVIHAGTPYKKHPGAPRVPLPTGWDPEMEPLVSTLQHRRSQRKFNNKQVPLQVLSFLLWASQGVTASAGKYLFRTAPSAGALYPVETYLAVQRIDGLEQGLYHFDPEVFELEYIHSEPVAEELSIAAMNQQLIHQAAVTFVWTTMYRRNMSKYGERGLRYMLMDAGHICQNLLLAAEAKKLSGCPVAAFFDDEVNEILGVDSAEETALYMAALGSPKE